MEKIPEELKKLQEQRLTLEEWKRVKKLLEKIQKMKSITRSQKDDILEYVKNNLNCSIMPFNDGPKDLEIWKITFNNKDNFLVFDLLNNRINIVPSGVFSTD